MLRRILRLLKDRFSEAKREMSASPLSRLTAMRSAERNVSVEFVALSVGRRVQASMPLGKTNGCRATAILLRSPLAGLALLGMKRVRLTIWQTTSSPDETPKCACQPTEFFR